MVKMNFTIRSFLIYIYIYIVKTTFYDSN